MNNNKITRTTKSNEDYLEAIYTIGGANSKVKSVDIAQALGVSKPAVSNAMNELIALGLIEKESYGDIQLTKKGQEIAQQVKKKHDLIKSFLIILGVSNATAEVECCKLEHILSQETISCIKTFIANNS